jgi:hypothetical protein
LLALRQLHYRLPQPIIHPRSVAQLLCQTTAVLDALIKRSIYKLHALVQITYMPFLHVSSV